MILDLWFRFLAILPVEWAQPGQFLFMKHALLAIILLSVLFGLLSTMVVVKRMSFFSDALGHSAFTGVAIGIFTSWIHPSIVAILFAVLFSWSITIIGYRTKESKDTLIGVFSSIVVSIGIFLSTWSGSSFNKLSRYLIGDILSITRTDLISLLFLLVFVFTLWCFAFNPMLIVSLNSDFAYSRRMNPFWMDFLFSSVLAVSVTLSISWVGLLVINSMLVLPAATAKNLSFNVSHYHRTTILLSFLTGITGLLVSYYLGTSTGATIVIIQGLFFIISYFFRRR